MGGCDLVRLGQLGLPAACSSTLDPALHVVPENGLVLGPKYTGNPWLVGGNPSEKYESQLELLFPIYGKMKAMFQTTNQMGF